MSTHTAVAHWQRQQQVFSDYRDSRARRWLFDGGIEVPASSSAQVVPLPMSEANAVDPEEACVASLSSCHRLWFLDLARQAGWRVDDDRDEAQGVLGRRAEGRLAMTRVTLRPRVAFSVPQQPDAAEVQRLHHAAHEACFIARSVNTEVRCEPVT